MRIKMIITLALYDEDTHSQVMTITIKVNLGN